MTMGAQVLLTIAMSVVTGGVEGTLVGAAAGTLKAALASAAFTTLVSQTAVSLINNQGNLPRVFKDMSSSQALISLATSTMTAGISHQFGPSSLNTFTDHFHNAGVQCIPVTTVSVLRNPNMKQALKQGLLDIGVSFAGSYGAKTIGDMRHSIDFKVPSINWLLPNVLHGMLGAAMGTALSEDRKLGAFSGMLGAVAAEIIAEQITPSAKEFYKSLLAKAQKENRILSKTEMLDLHLQALQLRANIARMTTATILFLAKKDVAIGDITGSNALQNNFSLTMAYKFGELVYNYAQSTYPEETEIVKEKVSEGVEEVSKVATQEIPPLVESKGKVHGQIDWLHENHLPLPIFLPLPESLKVKIAHGMVDLSFPITGLDLVLTFGAPAFKTPGVIWKGVNLARKGIKPWVTFLAKTPYGKEIINFSKPLVKKGIQLFEKIKSSFLSPKPKLTVSPGLNVMTYVPVGFNKAMHTGIIWGRGILEQGIPWENHLSTILRKGARLPQNFKTFDFYDDLTHVAISAKTLNTQTFAKLANPKQIYYSLKRNIDEVANFTKHELNKRIVTSEMIQFREVHVAIPQGTTSAQWNQIKRAIDYGKTKNIHVEITEIY